MIDSTDVKMKGTSPSGMVSYPHLFEIVEDDQGKKKTDVTLAFSPEAQATPEYAAMKAAAKAAGIATFGPDFESRVLKGELRWPFRKDDGGKYGAGYTYVGFRLYNALPGVVSRFADATGKPERITKEQQTPGHPNEVYPGSQGRVSWSAFAYNKPMNKGVSFGLNNFQKTGDGTRIDGRKAATDEFEADLTQAPASLDSLI